MALLESCQSPLPDIDERLVAPETPFEILDGRVIYVPPADDPHGIRHAQILLLIGAHVAREFQVACDMLTRTSKVDDFAPDVSVFPVARHPETGRRQLEHLAFEVVSTQSLGHAGKKAGKLVGRGVRRVFAIDVERSRALEWSQSTRGWREVDTAFIEDPVFDVPLPVESLVRTVKGDDDVARALLAKRNHVFEAAMEQAHQEGSIAKQREMLIVVLGARGIALDAAARERILGEPDPVRLDRWIARAATQPTIAEVFAEP